MKILATDSETVTRRLRAAGLTDKQARQLLNRTLLCLDYIGGGKRVSVEAFECFAGERTVKGHRLRFNQLLTEARLIERTRPHVQSLCSAEYRAKGKPVAQVIQLNKPEAQIRRKIEAEHRKTARADKTLQWLNRAIKHTFEGETYFSLAKGLQWPSVSLQRAFAGIVAAAMRRDFLRRYFRKLREDGLIQLEDEDGSKSYRRAELSADYFDVAEVFRFADDLRGEPCTVEDLEDLQFGRVAYMAWKEEFKYLRRRFEKDLVEKFVSYMKARNFHCAADGLNLYAEDAEALEQAFVQAVDHTLHVDITRRDKPILTPLYIDRLRRLKAKKEGIDLSEVPKARAKHWQPKTREMMTKKEVADFWGKTYLQCWGEPEPKEPEDRRIAFERKPFQPTDNLLETVEEAKAFYAVDPEAEEEIREERKKADQAEEDLKLYLALRQIRRWGKVRAKASEAKRVTAELYEMGHALPTEPTLQEWELTETGRDCLLASEGKSATRPLPERDRAESYATYIHFIEIA